MPLRKMAPLLRLLDVGRRKPLEGISRCLDMLDIIGEATPFYRSKSQGLAFPRDPARLQDVSTMEGLAMLDGELEVPTRPTLIGYA